MGQKWVLGCVKTHFSTHLKPISGYSRNPLFTQVKEGGNSFPKRPLRQSRPSILLDQWAPRPATEARNAQAMSLQAPRGPTATIILSRYTVGLHSVALRFPGFGVVSQENRATPRSKGPLPPIFSALKGGVALQVASWRSWCRGASQLHCRLSRCSLSAKP